MPRLAPCSRSYGTRSPAMARSGSPTRRRWPRSRCASCVPGSTTPRSTRSARCARRGEALRSCAPYLSEAAIARAISEIEAWLPRAGPLVAFLVACDLLPLVPARDRERARCEIVRLRAALEAKEAEDGPRWGFSARKRAAEAFAVAGMFEASEAECQGLDNVDDLLSVAREHPGESCARIARIALSAPGRATPPSKRRSRGSDGCCSARRTPTGSARIEASNRCLSSPSTTPPATNWRS